MLASLPQPTASTSARPSPRQWPTPVTTAWVSTPSIGRSKLYELGRTLTIASLAALLIALLAAVLLPRRAPHG